jgi:hypothetical protein
MYGSSTVHVYTQTIHRTTQNKQYIEQHQNFGRVRAVPRLCGLYPGICLTTEEGKTSIGVEKNSVRVGKTYVRVGKTSVRVEKPQSG